MLIYLLLTNKKDNRKIDYKMLIYNLYERQNI